MRQPGEEREPNPNMTNTETTTTENTAVVAEQGATTALRKAPSKKGSSQKKGASKAKKGAKEPKKVAKAKKAKPACTKDAAAPAPRAESKGVKILELISRAKGATLAEIQKATGWQAHSVRGFLSTAAKKHGINIQSSRTEGGDRVYQVEK